MTLSEELAWRGFVHQSTYTDLSILDKKPLTFYHGFDASADSQTVGNLAAMMLDRMLLKHGHKAIILAGGATSLIGDPGGKDKERPLQDEETIAHNVRCAEEQIKKIYKGYKYALVNNLDWTKGMSVLEFLRDIGKHYSMTPLVQRDYIAQRIGEGGAGISYTELSYTLLQGMDYMYLFDNYDCSLQLGASDQWGNCLSGVELIRKARGEEVHVLTMPLIINKTTGKKFGKSEEGAVWLDPARTTPTQFYQFWINVDDAGVESYLKIFTDLSKEFIEKIMTKHKKNVQERHAQKRLAEEVTALVHGSKSMDSAQAVTSVLTGEISIGKAGHVLNELRQEIPSVKAEIFGSITQALVAGGLATSNTDGRRLLGSNAISINGKKIHRGQFEEWDFKEGRLLLRRGKAFKDTILVELTR